MKSKRIIIIFSIVVFFAVAVVLTSVLFRIEEVEVVCLADKVLYSEKSKTAVEAEIEDSLTLKHKGTSIFFLNEKKLANDLEAEFTNLKVVNIERKFPKKVYITVQERIEVYCFEIGEDYVYTDYNCKVLRIEKEKKEIYGLESGETIRITKVNRNLISDYRIGEIIEFFEYGATKFLTELYLNTTNNPMIFRKYIKSVDINKFYFLDIAVSGSIVEINMRTGAKFTFFRTSTYGEKFILYMNGLMEIDDNPIEQIEIDRIGGIYEIRYVEGVCKLYTLL